MWTMANKIPSKIKSGINYISDSPFKKMENVNPNINIICDGNRIRQMKSISDNQLNNTPFKFDFNLFFPNPKSSFTPINQIDNYYYFHPNDINQNQNMPICLLFKASLEKSGYKLTPEQTVQYKDIYKKYNSINSFYDDFNYNYNFPIREYPINNNNNIINNIYPTFNKVTNVQILSENDNIKNNSYCNKDKNNNNIDNLKNSHIEIENKKENIDESNIDKKESSCSSQNKEEKKSINNISVLISDNESNANKKQKKLFECSESNGSISPVSSKNFLKKKRLRKNNEQLELLNKFYLENKNWTKEQIKEISKSIGLKETKIYKWLWDQKNKEYKFTKFVVNKNKEDYLE